MAEHTYFAHKEFAKAYEEGKYSRPSSTRPEDRDASFFITWCRYVYSSYCYGAASVRNGGVMPSGRTIHELRSYARGQQNVNKYKEWCDVVVSHVNERMEQYGQAAVTKASIMNISWENVSVLPPMRDIALSKLNAPRYEPVIRATDTIAQHERRKKYLRDRAAADNRMKALFQKSNMMPDGVGNNVMQMDQGDVDIANQLDGYVLPIEVLLQDVVEASLDKSSWRDIKPMIAKDVFDLNMAGIEVLPNSKTGRVYVKYIDPAGIIAPVSKYNDGRDLPYIAKIESISISQLRQESGISEKELYLIAKRYRNYGPNVAISSTLPEFTNRGWREEYMQTHGHQVYDNFTVCVMTLYFKALDVESYIVGARSDGGGVFDQVGSESVLNNGGSNAGKELVKMPIQYIYKSKWIPDTDHVFDYGKCEAITRAGEDGEKEAVLPLILWVGDGPSIVERCIGVIDDIQLAVLKRRALFANLPPGPRLSIDTALMAESVQFGSTKLDMKDVLKIYAGRGVLFYRSKPEFANPDFGASNRPPVSPLQTAIQEDFNLFAISIQEGISMLRQATGVNEVADGTASGNDLLVGTAQELNAASNNALVPYMEALQSMYERMVSQIAKKYQSLAAYGEIKMTHWPMYSNTIMTLELKPDLALYNMEVSSRILPADQEIAMWTNDVLMKQQEGKLNAAQVFVIMEMLNDRDVKKAKIYISKAVAVNEAKAFQQQQTLIATQSQSNAEAAMAIEESKRTTSAMDWEGKSRFEQQRHRNKLEIMEKQSQLRQVENAFQGQVEISKELALSQ